MWLPVMKYDQLEALVEEVLQDERLVFGTLSKVRQKGQTPYHKVSIRPLLLRDALHYQITYHYDRKELHENLEPGETQDLVLRLLQGVFRQGFLHAVDADWQVLVSKKGAVRIIQHPPSRVRADLSHDRAKRYLLAEGTPYPFLVELGVMNNSGQVLTKRYHKFRQLNKFLEIVEDCLPALEQRLAQGGSLRIVDFGSGKAYLTFALYHYLVEHLQLPVEMIGLDLKEDVVLFGNQVATKLAYENLKFYHGDIRDFHTPGQVDMVVSLHACDIATDYALAQAVRWQAKLILAVPCCQHELFNQLKQVSQKPLLEHGVIKERVAALVTDAARAKLLEMVGYSVTIMEFIDLEHTPKNLLLRAFYDPHGAPKDAQREYLQFKEFWNIEPSLESLLAEEAKNARSK